MVLLIDNVVLQKWTEGGLPDARRIALDRLCHMKTEKKQAKNIVVSSLLSYKGYGLLKEIAEMRSISIQAEACISVNRLYDTGSIRCLYHGLKPAPECPNNAGCVPSPIILQSIRGFRKIKLHGLVIKSC